MDMHGHFDFLDVGNVDGFVLWHWDWDFLDDSQSLLLMVMMMGLFMVIVGLFMMVCWLLVVNDFVMTEILVLVAVAATEAVTTEVMIEETTFVLLFARFSLDGLLFFLCLLFSGNA
jgi:hypothetical protein